MNQADTITPQYAALNAQLHAEKPLYGANGWKRAVEVLDVLEAGGYRSVLDYGCGKGTLRHHIGAGYQFSEYDPAIAGKDEPPAPADLVVCFDVLEHVEPDKLDKTLEHLAGLARRELLFTIATRPSTQTLADGRNAHLIIENAQWWRERLERWFQIGVHGGDEGEFWGRASPLGNVGPIRSRMALTNDERNAQVMQNCLATDRRIADRGKLEPHDCKAILLCYGPSLNDTFIDVLKSYPEVGTRIFTVSAAHRYAIENGVLPYAHIDCDPRPHKVTQIGEAHPSVEYWLASCVHPSYLEHVRSGRALSLWHAYNGPDSQAFLNREIDPEAHMIIGGGSVGLRAMSLLYALGYRRFEVHGMDCSFQGEAQHAGEHHGKRKDAVTVWTPDGREFQTSAALILYFRYFYKQRLWMTDADIDICGDGLLQHSIRTAKA